MKQCLIQSKHKFVKCKGTLYVILDSFLGECILAGSMITSFFIFKSFTFVDVFNIQNLYFVIVNYMS